MTPSDITGIVAGCIVLTIAGAAADRLRGTDHLPALVSKLLHGFVAAIVVCYPTDGWFVALFIALFAAGASPGWGRPLGVALGAMTDGPHAAKPERWQVGPLLNDKAALVFRGFMWMLPTVPLYFFTNNPMYLTAWLVMGAAFFAAPYIVVALDKQFPVMLYNLDLERWAAQEWLRGALCMGGWLTLRILA